VLSGQLLLLSPLRPLQRVRQRQSLRDGRTLREVLVSLESRRARRLSTLVSSIKNPLAKGLQGIKLFLDPCIVESSLVLLLDNIKL